MSGLPTRILVATVVMISVAGVGYAGADSGQAAAKAIDSADIADTYAAQGCVVGGAAGGVIGGAVGAYTSAGIGTAAGVKYGAGGGCTIGA